jgi:predicted nucleic acid-binding Zn ribbon protein
MQPIAQAIPRAVAELLRTTPLSPGKIEFVWKTVVGPAMDRGTAVRLDGKTLLVEARTTAWAREVTRSSHVILRRIDGLLGPDVVRELVVRV